MLTVDVQNTWQVIETSFLHYERKEMDDKVKEGLQECDHIHQVYYRDTNQIRMMKLMRAFG